MTVIPGTPTPAWSKRGTKIFLPADRFAHWIERICERAGGASGLAQLLGRDEANVRRWMERETIADTIVDEVVCKLGDPFILYELYPELPDVAAALFGDES